MIGLEGMLGIIIEVIVKLLLILLGIFVMGVVFFDNMIVLVKVVMVIWIFGVYLMMLEVLDGNMVVVFDCYEKMYYVKNSVVMLIFKFDNGG